MKVIKPQRLSLLQRIVTHERRHTLVVSVLVYVPLDSPRNLLTEQNLWNDVGDQIPGGIVDEGLPKPCSEVLVSGFAFAPGGVPAAAVDVRVAMSRDGESLVDKRLAVWGNRYWEGGSPSEPVPFQTMPIDWSVAFGGDDFARNPDGKGAVPIATKHGSVHPLPNVEDPGALVTSPSDQPEPISFSAYGLGWPQRFAKLGTRYDQAWLEQRSPGPAEDFDVSFYCAAAPDQSVPGYLTGREQIDVDGMHPGKASVTGQLEPLVVRVFACHKESGDRRRPNDPSWAKELRGFETRLDTVHVLPALERAVLVYRANIAVRDDDADDVAHILVAAEALGHPKQHEHYVRAMERRLDKDGGALSSLRDDDLLPSGRDGYGATLEGGDIGPMLGLDHRKLGKGARGLERQLAAAKQKLEDVGFDVGDAFAPPATREIPDPYDIDALVECVGEMQAEAVRSNVEAEARKSEMEAEARHSFEQAGFDYDAEMTKAQEESGGPPAFVADEHMVMLHDMARIAAQGGQPMFELERALTDPRYERMLRELEERVRASYLEFAHVMPPVLVDAAAQQLLRVQVQAAKDTAESMSRRNLSGADLHGLDLTGMDFSGAMLEGVNLSGADLSGANLAGAVLSRATLADTNFTGADLTGANLGATKLDHTNLNGAVLDDAVLMRAELAGTLLIGASLKRTDFIETKFTAADLSHVVADQPLFLQADLRNVIFTGARMVQARFIETDVRGVDFTGAELAKAQFTSTEGDGASFAGADLTGAIFVHGSSFNNCSYAEANLSNVNFHKTPLRGCDFTGALLHGANLSACDVRGANLRRVRARNGIMIRTDFAGADLTGADLLGSVLQRAKLFATNLTGTNLSRADLSMVQVDGNTRVDDALMLSTRVHPQHQEEVQ